MERKEALDRLQELEGRNLHELARKYQVTVHTPTGNVNKGWAGHVIERYLGLPINSSQSPNFGSWELKTVPVNQRLDGSWRYKETMAVTMIDDYQVQRTPFDKSHLLSKLQKFVLVVRSVGANIDEPSFVVKTTSIDLTSELLEQVRSDYDEVRNCLLDKNRGFDALTGKMGVYIQPRTKGPGGKAYKTRAFYARPIFLEKVAPLHLI